MCRFSSTSTKRPRQSIQSSQVAGQNTREKKPSTMPTSTTLSIRKRVKSVVGTIVANTKSQISGEKKEKKRTRQWGRNNNKDKTKKNARRKISNDTYIRNDTMDRIRIANRNQRDTRYVTEPIPTGITFSNNNQSSRKNHCCIKYSTTIANQHFYKYQQDSESQQEQQQQPQQQPESPSHRLLQQRRHRRRGRRSARPSRSTSKRVSSS